MFDVIWCRIVLCYLDHVCFYFFFKQKTAYEMRISDWSSDVCSSDLLTMLKAAAVVLAATLGFGTAQAADISGAGATFPYPIYAKWADAYKKDTGIGLNYQSIGSGGGIKQIKAKTVNFGAPEDRKRVV